MNFLIIGGGSIGKRHLKNLLSLKETAAVCEPIKDRAKAIADEYRVQTFLKLENALKNRFDAALITNPNIYHLTSAIEAAKAGCHLFIEKPLSHSLKGVDGLIKLVVKKKLKTLLGCNWKFYPSFKQMKALVDKKAIGKIMSFTIIAGQYLPDWHPWEDYRKGYSANRSLGGGVLLDSHELDYLQWFLGPIKKLASFTGKYSDLEIDTEDIAEMIVELKGKVVGNVHVDYIQHPYRKIYFFYGEKGAMEWSFREKKISMYLADKKEWQFFNEDPGYDINGMYLEEMRHFINVVKGEERSLTDIYKARQILEVIEAAKRSSGKQEVVNI
jgi:predicted dehydrogenase